MNSQLIVEKYEAKLQGQLLLFPDPDIILRQTKFQATNDPVFDRDALIHWWMEVYVPDGYGDYSVTQEVFSSWSNAQYNYFKYTMVSGYNPATSQSLVKFGAYKKEDVEVQKEELKLWLPYIKPCRDKEDREGKFIDIFEHTLSEHGSYYLWIYSDKEYVLQGSYREIKNTDNLGQMVCYIADNHWYQKRHRES